MTRSVGPSVVLIVDEISQIVLGERWPAVTSLGMYQRNSSLIVGLLRAGPPHRAALAFSLKLMGIVDF